jgi:hypothetical protein
LSIEAALLRPEFWGGVVHEKLAVVAQPVLSNGLLAARKDTRNPTAAFPGLSQRIGQFCDALANAIRLDIAGCELLMCKELVTHALEVLKRNAHPEDHAQLSLGKETLSDDAES